MTRREIIDWRQRIIEAEERFHATGGHEGFTAVDRMDASGWQGCAVGEAYAKAGRKMKLILSVAVSDEAFRYEGPRDWPLNVLGGQFSDVVQDNNFLRAYEIIDLIEARVLTLRYRAKARG